MNILIIYAHPYEKSYNHALKETVINEIKENNNYEIIDLYNENFNPVLSKEELSLYSKGEVKDNKILEYQEKIVKAEHIVFIFPIWWGLEPAILKGFIDRVFTKGFAYDIKGIMLKGLLKNKSATVISTMNTPKFVYNFIFKKPVKQSLILLTLKFCGIKKVKWLNFTMVSDSEKNRKNYIEKLKKYFKKSFFNN